MKTTLKLIIAALAAITSLASCQKENAANNGNTNPSADGVRVLTLSFDSGTKATLNGLQPEFQDGEYVKISNGITCEDKQISVAGGVATITTSLSGPLTAVIPSNAAKMNGNKIDGVKILASQTGLVSDALICMATGAEDATSLHFTCQTALFIVTPPAGVKRFAIQASGAINNSSSVSYNISVGDGENARGTYYVSLVPGVKLNQLNFVTDSAHKTINSTTVTAANTAYTITNTWSLSGRFSVASGKQVHFSPGNLTYNVSTDTWAFYDHQYDCASGYDANLISLFTWGFGTWSTTPDTQLYLTTHTSAGENFESSEDWGSQIVDGNTWRTLTIDEWNYLKSSITERNDKHKTGVTVCGKTNCLILAPDDWNLSANPLQSSYDETSWPVAEAAGLVCLPAAGYRSGSTVNNSGERGMYWSSTLKEANYIWALGYHTSFFDLYGSRDRGYSVRLVTNAE